MRRRVLGGLLAGLLMLAAMTPAGAETVLQINGELETKTQEQTLKMAEDAADAYFRDEEAAAELEKEIRKGVIRLDVDEAAELPVYTLTHGGVSMRFLMEIRGEPGEGGYPLYLALHGGGGAPPEDNDEQWGIMYDYYRWDMKSGIYVAIRGITDTWDLHFRPESYPMYDRLIRAMIRLYGADPNRVYLLGFSAGGDGVYQIAPRMADRFAAAGMSSGHPNGVSLRNLANLPFSIQAGVHDYYTEDALRCVRAAEFEKTLNDYREALGGGYEHQVLIRVPDGHGFDDSTYEKEAEVLADPTAYADPAIVMPMLERFMEACETAGGPDTVVYMSYVSAGELPEFDSAVRKILTEEYGLALKKVKGSAMRFVDQFTRNPVPDAVVWDLGTRAETREADSFYWLRAEPAVNQGTICARVTGDNALNVTPEGVNGDFSILVNPRLVDVSRPVHITTPEGEFDVMVNPSEETLRESIRKTGDPFLAWVAEIPYSQLTAAR